MSLALYRRYRPETFEEVIGQDHVTGPLQQALRNGRVNHAYLFSGPRGCGKTTSARILARAINCENGPTPTPCGTCRSCQELARGGGGSIDVIEIDAASHGGVDDARDLRERAFFAPAAARYKVYIIDEAHMVTSAGFNALLKVVEEPPEHLKFIFATTEPDKVIGTIRSRTHHYPFRLVPPGVMRDYLGSVCASEGVDVEQGVLPLVVRAGGGSVRDSMSVLDQLLAGAAEAGVSYQMATSLLGYTDATLLDDVVGALAAHDGAAVFELIHRIVEGGHEPRRFVADLLERIRDLIVLRAVPAEAAAALVDVPDDQAERMRQQAAAFGAAELSRAADIANTGLTEMRGATAPRLQLELIGARLLLPAADDTERGLAARLDQLERRIALGIPVAAPPERHDGRAGRPIGADTDEPVVERPAGRPRPTAADPARDAGTRDDASGAPAGDVHGDGVHGDPAEAGNTPGAPASRSIESRPIESRPIENGPPARRPDAPAAPGTPTLGTPPWKRAAAASQPDPGPEPEPERPAGRPGGAAEAPSRAGTPRPDAGAPQAAPERPGDPAAPVGAGGAGGDAVAMRRLWPEVLDAVKTLRRFTWILLSQHAQVVGADGRTLQLGFATAGARDSFVNSSSDDVLRQALSAKLGADWRVEAIVDPSRGSEGPQQARPEPARRDEPEQGGGGPPRGGASSDAWSPSAAEAPSWAAPASEPPSWAAGPTPPDAAGPGATRQDPAPPRREHPSASVSPASEPSPHHDAYDEHDEHDDPADYELAGEEPGVRGPRAGDGPDAPTSRGASAGRPPVVPAAPAGPVGLELLARELGANMVEEYENPL